jgi:hypothetical protein
MTRIARSFAFGLAALACAASAGAIHLEGFWRGTITCQPPIRICEYKFERESLTPGAFTMTCPP